MTQVCIDQNRVIFSCKLVTLAAKYDKMLCMNLDTSSILSTIVYARNLLTTLCNFSFFIVVEEYAFSVLLFLIYKVKYKEVCNNSY